MSRAARGRRPVSSRFSRFSRFGQTPALHTPPPPPPLPGGPGGGWQTAARGLQHRLRLEPLEPRWLLSLTNADISSPQQQTLLDGLDGFVAWAEGWEQHDLAHAVLPVANQSLGPALDLSDVLDTGWVQPVHDYFAGDATPTTDELVTVLQQLSGSYGNLTVTVHPAQVVGGLDTFAGGSELIFQLVLAAERSMTAGMGLGPRGSALGLNFGTTSQVDLQLELAFDFAFGVDLAPGLSAAEAFFLRVTQLSASAAAEANGMSSVSFKAGMFDAALSGNMSLSAQLIVSLANPDQDPRSNISLQELTSTPLPQLVGLVPSGTASGNLTLNVGSFGGFTPTLNPSISFSTANPFQPVTLTLSGFDELLPFTNVSSSGLLSLVGQVGTWLGQLGSSDLLDTAVQLVAGKSLGDVLNLSGAWDEGFRQQLVHAEGSPWAGMAKFDSVQSLATTLETVLGLSAGTIDARYDGSARELSYHVLVDHTFDRFQLPFELGLDLGPVADLQTSAEVELDVATALEFTLGLDLSRFHAELLAASAAPAHGRLTSDATFLLMVGGQFPVAVTVPQSATATNNDLDDLVGDLNTALAAAGLATQVTAARDATQPQRLLLRTAYIGPVVTLAWWADSQNAAVTELGFEPQQFAFDAGFDDLFVEDASISATASLAVNTVDATVDLGFVALSVADGAAAADFAVSLELVDPATQTAGGRVYLDELFQAAASDISQVLTGPQLSGSLQALLPLSGVILGLPTAGNPHIAVDWPDMFQGGPQVDFHNMEDLLNFEHLSEAQIFAALGGVGSLLQQIQNFSFYNIDIPGLGLSLGQLFDYADPFLQLVAGLGVDPDGNLDQLESKLEAALGLDDDALDLSLEDDYQVLRMDFSVGQEVATQVPVHFNLGPQLDHVVDVYGEALLTASAGVRFDFSLGLDLTEPAAPRPLLYESTSLTLTGRALGTNINFTAGWGMFGLFVQNGSFALDTDGNPATPDDSVTLTVGLTDNNATTADGKIYLDALDLGSHVAINLEGKVVATLPLYFPTASQFQGNIELTIDDLSDIEHTTSLTFPQQQLEEERDGFDLLNNLGGMLDTFDFILRVVEDAFRGEVFGIRLPFLGNDFRKAARVLEDFRTGFLQELRHRFQEANNQTPEVVRQALLDALGPGGLNLLQDRNGSGTITTDDIHLTEQDLDGDGEADDGFQFDLLLQQELVLLDEAINFDLGLPALGLQADGDVELALAWTWAVSFGVDRVHGFYLDTTQEDEIQLGLVARIPDLVALGQLLFLQVEIRDEDADGNPLNTGADVDGDGRYASEFVAGLTIDLLDPVDDPGSTQDDGKLTFGDVISGNYDLADLVSASLEGMAGIYLDLELSILGDKRFPTISGELDLVWPFSVSDPDLTGSTPTVAFNDVRLNVGEMVNDFAASALQTVQEATRPAQPIVDFLTAPIPIISDFGQDVTPLLIAEQVARAYGFEFVTDFIQAVADIVTLVNNIPPVSDEIYISLGSFDLTGTDPRDEEDLDDVTPHVTETVDPVAELATASPEARGFFDDLHDLGIYLPLIESPANVFRLLLGQTVDLFLYDMPALKFEVPFPVIRIGPIVPPYPIFASFTGVVGVSIDLAFGFDTRGWEIYRETHDVLDIFSGFFISDRANPDGTGEDVPEAVLFGRLDAAVDVSIWVVSAGVGGGVTLALGADLVDPNNDGRVHLDEFLDNIELGVSCTFDLQGEVYVELFAFVELIGVRLSYRSPRITLVDFELTDSDCYPDRFQGNDSLSSATDLGIGPGLHLEGMSLETPGDVDWYRFELLRPDDMDVNVRHSHVKGNVDLDLYNAAGQLLASGTTDKDGEIVHLLGAPAGVYYARVRGSGVLNNYKFLVVPGRTSSTRVIYVSPSGAHDQAVSYRTWEPGRDTHDGLTPSQPKATLQSVLDSYTLGPNDVVVFDTGRYPDSATLGTEDRGATYLGALGGSSLGRLLLSGAEDSWFVQLTFAAAGPPLGAGEGQTPLITLDAAHGHLFDRVVFQSATPNVLLMDAHHNRFSASHFQGSGDGIVLDGDGWLDATGNLLLSSEFQNGQTAILVRSQAANTIHGNTILGPGATGILVAPAVPATFTANDISGRDTGFYVDSKIANSHGNLVHHNQVGMASRQGVICFAGCGWTDPEAPLPNQVYQNGVGILLPLDAWGVLVGRTDIFQNQIGIQTLGDRARLVSNRIFDNAVGIEGTGPIGPENWQSDLFNLIHGNGVGVRALRGSEVRYNRIFENGTGVEIASAATVHHNVIYRNTAEGILIVEADGATAVNNTVVAPAGHAARLSGFLSQVVLRNNIFWTQTGVALYVEAAAQFGYDSDYNNLYTAAGAVAFQGKTVADLYDWMVEAESDLHSLGSTVLDPLRDDPLFVDMAQDDYHLRGGSTSIDAGDPSFDFALEPAPHGGRVNLGAYGNTPLATASAPSWLAMRYPEFYADLDHDQWHEIRWESFNLTGETLAVRLVEEGTGTVTQVATVPESQGSTLWRPSDLGIAGSTLQRYRIELHATGGSGLVARSREPFAVVDFDSAIANTFYVDDASDDDDEYTPDVTGNNRHTGLTPLDPKGTIRPLVLSYAMGAGDVVRVDTGTYVLMVNLNLRRTPLSFDARLQSVSETRLTGPTNLNLPRPLLDRANPHPGAVAIDLRDAPQMELYNLEIVGAHTGVRAREGSVELQAQLLSLHDHAGDGLSMETSSHAGRLDQLQLYANGRHGLFVDSRLESLRRSEVYDNGAIGAALRGIGAAVIESSQFYQNGVRGLDVFNSHSQTAVVGHLLLDSQWGNLVHHNAEEGIYAAGNVLVAGNTVWQNHAYGIRLADGADAHRNVVHEHERGISARGSSSDIIENRSFINGVTGIEASLFSQVLRNVTYTNDLHGIHADQMGGRIEHNLIYQTGYASVHIEGPGRGTQFVNNTVYETCFVNDELPHQGPTPLQFEWDWNVLLDPPDFPPPPQPPFPQLLWGSGEFLLGEAVGQITGAQFNLGPGGTINTPTPLPLPEGEPFVVDILVPSFELSTTMGDPHPDYGHIFAGPSEYAPPSSGRLTLENQAGFLVGQMELVLFVEFRFSDYPAQLVPEIPLVVSWSFDATDGLGPLDLLQIPAGIPADPGRPPVPLQDLWNPSMPPWEWQLVLGEDKVTDVPPPQDRGDTCAEIAVLVDNQSRRVTLRNNIIYAEGDATGNQPNQSIELVVEADSIEGWDSEFNVLPATHGNTGSWAGGIAPDLASWQMISPDDDFSIDPNAATLWVDPDGDDQLLGGFQGEDDNFHLRSPFGHALRGALAPIVDPGSGLPAFEPVAFFTAATARVADVSPAVDLGDPSYDFSWEPSTHGQMINAGTYGNTLQASATPVEYIHIVQPLGLQEWVRGGTYELRWRSDGLGTVDIELQRNGSVETVIATGTPDTGSLVWTVPGTLPEDTNYEIRIFKTPQILLSETVIEGWTRRQFTILGADLQPPAVLSVAPDLLDTTMPADTLPTRSQLPTRLAPATFLVQFSENLFGPSAGHSANYELLGAGPAGATVFDDGDDLLYSLTATYTPAAYDGDPSSVLLDLAGVVLPEGLYRLRISAGLADPAGNALDGDGDGSGGDAFIQFFEIDTTAPSVALPVVSPNPTNQPFDSLTIQFSEAVRDFGLDDLQLALHDPSEPNLLTGSAQLSTDDAIVWTLSGLASVAQAEGHYYLTLSGIASGIVDLAGNALALGDAVQWELDLTAPVLTAQPVTPDPRNSGVSGVGWSQSEPLVGFSDSDLWLTRDGQPIAGDWVGITSVEGIYHLTLRDDADVTDLAGNPLAYLPHEVWQVFTTPPAADIVDLLPDPRNQTVHQLFIRFTRPVTGFDLADLRLTRNGSANLFTGGESLTTIDNLHYTLSGLSALTGVAGSYLLTLDATGSGIADLAGNALLAGATQSWTMDVTAPTLVGIVPVSPDPRNTPVDEIQLVFSKTVFGFDLADLTMARHDGAWSGNLLTAAQTLSSSDGVTWRLSNLAAITAAGGQYELQLDAGSASIEDQAGNALTGGGLTTWQMDLVSPTAAIVELLPDPRPQGPASMTLAFSEAVVGLDLSDLTLRRDGGPNLLTAAQSLTSSDSLTWQLQNLSTLTALPGEYELSLRAFGSGIADLAGNPLLVGNFDLFRVLHPADFNADGQLDCQDIDALVAGIAAGTYSALLDLVADDLLDLADLDAWLQQAGAANLGAGRRYGWGDGNLDGVVDVSDFNLWNSHKFTSHPSWCAGDFNADGVVDVSDFNLWNANKFVTSTTATGQPLGGRVPLSVPASYPPSAAAGHGAGRDAASWQRRIDQLFRAEEEQDPCRGDRV